MAKAKSSRATKAVNDASTFAYADNVYEAALDKVGKKLNMRARLDVGMKTAYNFLRKQGIDLTRDQIAAYYKRHPKKPCTPEEQAEIDRKNRDYARGVLLESLSLLADSVDLAHGMLHDRI